MSLPNLLSALRLVATPGATSLILGGRRLEALLLFAAAALTDWLDGYIARRTGSESPLGALLDPVADKVFGVGVLWALVKAGSLPSWMLWTLLLKEGLLLIGGAFLLKTAGAVSRARLPGKAATAVLFVAFGAVLAGVEGFGTALAGVGVGLSLLAGVDYAGLALSQLRGSKG